MRNTTNGSERFKGSVLGSNCNSGQICSFASSPFPDVLTVKSSSKG